MARAPWRSPCRRGYTVAAMHAAAVSLTLVPAAHVAVIGAGALLLLGMLLGVWKYARMRRPPGFAAPVYVDIAHRAALMYAFAALVLAALAQLSAWPPDVNLVAVAVNLAFFVSAIASYVVHGLKETAETQFRETNFFTTWGTWALIAGEVGGTAVLLVGAVL
jgi:hypothetical protein